MKKELDKIYTMKLHEVLELQDKDLATSVIRVPGGWIYRSCISNCANIEQLSLTSTFVPFNKEDIEEIPQMKGTLDDLDKLTLN